MVFLIWPGVCQLPGLAFAICKDSLSHLYLVLYLLLGLYLIEVFYYSLSCKFGGKVSCRLCPKPVTLLLFKRSPLFCSPIPALLIATGTLFNPLHMREVWNVCSVSCSGKVLAFPLGFKLSLLFVFKTDSVGLNIIIERGRERKRD